MVWLFDLALVLFDQTQEAPSGFDHDAPHFQRMHLYLAHPTHVGQQQQFIND